MQYRLTHTERDELAFKLRAVILKKENPERLEIVTDPRFAPHFEAEGVYAFEFFLDRYRHRAKALDELVRYNYFWSLGSLTGSEESKSRERVVRITTALSMSIMVKEKTWTVAINSFAKVFASQKAWLTKTHIEMFLYEIMTELVAERARLIKS